MLVSVRECYRGVVEMAEGPTLWSIRYWLQERKMEQKLDESPAMSVEMYGKTPGLVWL